MAGRILVLDDEENYAEMLQDLLREHGYRVDMATRPERAIAQLEEIPYDLVISDYKMPVMDGADFLKKSRELYPHLPFILVSGLMNTPELVKVANMSVTLVLEKPLDTRQFLEEVARFSSPLTDEEREQLAMEGQDAQIQVNTPSYPAEPCFFSAHNFLAARFLQSLWSVAHSGHEVFILEPPGGDAELVIKDVSNWRGNADMPVAELSLPEDLNDGVRQIRSLLSDSNKSRVLSLRLNSFLELKKARKLSQQFANEPEGAASVLLVYIVPGTSEQAFEFKKLTGESGFVLPGMRFRPSDTAAYARRFARIAADRSGKGRCAEFSVPAAYALLAHEWPENYKQIRELIYATVELSGDAPISLEVFEQALGYEIGSVPATALPTLLKAQQGRFLKDYLEESGLSPAEILKELDLDPATQGITDLEAVPLLFDAEPHKF
ncbi:MAG: response regulator [Puniceicoccaceae bacterium]|nr:MAG: response regulator [Puniceicoccaceae bacterium]